jgi:hypothetical protein
MTSFPSRREVEVTVLWLDWLLIAEASGGLVFASWNCCHFVRHASQSRLRARRVAASALGLVNGALALEAACYLTWSLPVEGLQLAAVTFVRCVLLASCSFMSLLIWRHGRR